MGKNRHVIGEKKEAIFDWELGNSTAREGQKMPCPEMVIIEVLPLKSSKPSICLASYSSQP